MSATDSSEDTPTDQPFEAVPIEVGDGAAPEDGGAVAGEQVEAAPAEQAPAESGPVHRVVDVADPSRVRRAPRYGRFALAGLLLAMAVSFGLTFVPGAEDGLTRRNLFFLLLLALGSLGIILGLLVALWTDRRSLRRRR